MNVSSSRVHALRTSVRLETLEMIPPGIVEQETSCTRHLFGTLFHVKRTP